MGYRHVPIPTNYDIGVQIQLQLHARTIVAIPDFIRNRLDGLLYNSSCNRISTKSTQETVPKHSCLQMLLLKIHRSYLVVALKGGLWQRRKSTASGKQANWLEFPKARCVWR